MSKAIPAAGNIPHRGYAICGEPRVGSTYLARLARTTGVLGDPFEFFRTFSLATTVEREPGHLLELAARAATPNGIYALKVFAHQFDFAERSRWAERLPGLGFVHLEREDLLGQAISLVLARQTGRYQSYTEATGPPAYDGGAIASAMGRIAHNQARWRIWFARNAITPLRLTYESLCADPHGAVDEVAALVGVSEVRAKPDEVPVQVVRTSLNEDWRRRFCEERRDLGRLDAHFARLPAPLRRLRARLSS